MKSLILILSFSVLVFSAFKNSEKGSFSKVTTNDVYNFIAINQILMYISNNGDGSHNPFTDGNGFYWPGGENAVTSAIFEDGLVWGGKISETGVDTIDIRVNGNTHRQGLQAGKILASGLADEAVDLKYRVYKIRKGWEVLPPGEEKDAYGKDYNEWPVDDGAPWVDKNEDKMFTPGTDEPDFVGDEVLWFVSNDLDTSRSTFTYGSLPLGLEEQCTVFGFNRTGVLGDVIFKKYKVFNKGIYTIDSMYFSYWSDPDLGFAGDDFVGCDTVLNLAYTYNGDNNDEGYYGIAPPAVGYLLLQGPIIPANSEDTAFAFGKWHSSMINLPMTASILYISGDPIFSDPTMGNINGSIEFYNYMKGKIWNGNAFIDPHTEKPTKFALSGDPVGGTGWYEGSGWPGGPAPGDRRMMMSSGPFSFAPGDSQEVVYAIIMAQGADYLDSVTKLKEKAEVIRDYYYSSIVSSLTDRKDLNNPERFLLKQNYPNPFNPSTVISYHLSHNSKVLLKVYDAAGRVIKTLTNEQQFAGEHSVKFNGQNLASGIYFYRLEAGDFVQQKKMLLIK